MLEPYDEAEYRKAVADGDTSKARRMVRGLLHREGVLPRDAMLSLEANDLELKPATEMGDALAWHSSTGKMAIRSDLWADGTSSDKSKFAEQLATLTHEELHGSTKSNRHGFYVGYGATIEEVTVEMASRKVTRQAGFDYPYTKGSYQQQINQVGGLMQRTYDELGLEAPSNDDALSKIADAGVKMRSGKSKMAPASNEENILDQFLDSLDVPAKVKPALRKHIQAEVKAPK